MQERYLTAIAIIFGLVALCFMMSTCARAQTACHPNQIQVFNGVNASEHYCADRPVDPNALFAGRCQAGYTPWVTLIHGNLYAKCTDGKGQFMALKPVGK